MEQVLKEYGFILSGNNVRAKEYRIDDIVVYVIPSSNINLVISPEDYLFMRSFECKKYHNSNLKAFPKELNEGESRIHYGYKICFENLNLLREFLCQYVKYKRNI